MPPEASPRRRRGAAGAIPTRVHVAHRGLFVVAVDVQHLLVRGLRFQLLHLLGSFLERGLGGRRQRVSESKVLGAPWSPPAPRSPGAPRTSVIATSTAYPQADRFYLATPAARPARSSPDRPPANRRAAGPAGTNQRGPKAGAGPARSQCRGGAGASHSPGHEATTAARGARRQDRDLAANPAAGQGPRSQSRPSGVPAKGRDWRSAWAGRDPEVPAESGNGPSRAGRGVRLGWVAVPVLLRVRGGPSLPEEWATSASHLPACPRGGAGEYMVLAPRAMRLNSKCENWRFLIELPILCSHSVFPCCLGASELNAVPFTAASKSPAYVENIHPTKKTSIFAA